MNPLGSLHSLGPSRRGYIDWLQGHLRADHDRGPHARCLDAAGRAPQQHVRWAMIVGGFAARASCFLAGVAIVLAPRDLGFGAVERLARRLRLRRRRALQIFGLAFLFRLSVVAD